MAEQEDIDQVEAEDEGSKKSLFANKRLLIVIAIALLVIIIGIAAFLFLGSSDDTKTAADNETTELADTDELEDLPPEEMTDEDVSLELPTIPEEDSESPATASQSLTAISGALTTSKSPEESATSETENQSPINLPQGTEMPDFDDPNSPEQINKAPIMAIMEEFTTAEQMAEEIAKLRRRLELNTKETTRLYSELGDMEDKLQEKNRIIRAQDTAYLKGPKVSPKRSSGPIAPPEPTWDVSPEHTGP